MIATARPLAIPVFLSSRFHQNVYYLSISTLFLSFNFGQSIQSANLLLGLAQFQKRFHGTGSVGILPSNKERFRMRLYLR